MMMSCLFEFYIAYLLSISFAHLLHECTVDMSSITISIILLLICHVILNTVDSRYLELQGTL